MVCLHDTLSSYVVSYDSMRMVCLVRVSFDLYSEMFIWFLCDSDACSETLIIFMSKENGEPSPSARASRVRATRSASRAFRLPRDYFLLNPTSASLFLPSPLCVPYYPGSPFFSPFRHSFAPTPPFVDRTAACVGPIQSTWASWASVFCCVSSLGNMKTNETDPKQIGCSVL